MRQSTKLLSQRHTERCWRRTRHGVSAVAEMESLEEDLTCSVCYSLFTDPRVLPCSHTFCRACLVQVLQVSANLSIWRPLRLPLKCPNCRTMVELPQSGVDALPVNVCLRGIIEKYQREGLPHVPSCPEHPRQPLNVYCVQDRQLICGFCLTIGQHQGHAIDDLQTAYVKERDTPAGLVERLTDRRWEEVCVLVEQLEQEKSRQDGLVRRDREVVTQFFQDLERILTRKKEAFLKALDGAATQLTCIYDPLVEKLKDMKEEQLDLISLCTSVGDEESPLAFLETVHHLRERVDALTKTPLPEVPRLHISPHAEDFLEERWTSVTIGRLEDGPVPKVSCRVNACSAKGARQPTTRRRRLRPPVQSLTYVAFLVVVLLLFLLLWLNPVGGASLGFSILSQISQAVENLVDEGTTSLHQSGMLLCCFLHNLGLKFSSYISGLGESTYQLLVSSFSEHFTYAK